MRIKPANVDCILQLGDEWRVAPSDTLKHALELTLGRRMWRLNTDRLMT